MYKTVYLLTEFNTDSRQTYVIGVYATEAAAEQARNNWHTRDLPEYMIDIEEYDLISEEK